MKHLRFVFIGGNTLFSTIPLEELSTRHKLVGIVESAPRNFDPNPSTFKGKFIKVIRLLAKGRNLKSFARAKSIPYFLLTKNGQTQLKEFLDDIKPDIICVASMSQLLRPEIINLPKYGIINLHPSLLPAYRGPNPWFWQIYNMESTGGMTVHYIDEGEDTGDIVRQAQFDIPHGIRPRDLLKNTIPIGARLMTNALDDIARGTVSTFTQRHLACQTRASNINAPEIIVNWSDWPIERTWHVISWIEADLKSHLPIPFPCPGLYWKIGSLEKTSHRLYPGTVHHCSFNGFYIAHREGKIHLSLAFSVKQLLRELFQFLV